MVGHGHSKNDRQPRLKPERKNRMTIYTPTARFDQSGSVLSEDQLRRIAPSVFATEAHYSRSDRFAPIPTIDILRGLAKEGFGVVGAQQQVARSADRQNFTKHLLRLRKIEDRRYEVGDSVFEILLKNANDGSARYDLMGGLFRIICLNSLVAETPNMETVKVTHTGNAMQKVIEGTYKVLTHGEEIAHRSQEWRALTLDRDEREAFAVGAMVNRFGEKENEPGKPDTNLRVEEFMVPRRQADRGNDLWSVFNVAQEASIKGGNTGFGRNAAGQWRRQTTRQINGIDQSVKVNRGLWAMAEHLAALKKAA
jgi:hypothetical protein